MSQPPPNFSNPDSDERLSRIDLIEQLQKTIAQLNELVFKLNAESVEKLPTKTAVDSWVIITERLVESLEPSPVIIEEPPITETPFTEVTSEPSKPEISVVKVTSEPDIEVIPEPPEIPVVEVTSKSSEPVPVASTKPPQSEIPNKPPLVTPPFREELRRVSREEPSKGVDKILPSFNRLQSWWDGLLDLVRSFLPTSINNKISDWVLTGILTGSLVIILLTSVSLLNPSPKKEISQLPKINIEELPVEVPVEVTTEEPTLEPIEVPTEKAPEIAPETAISEAVDTPPELTAPESSQPVTIEPTEPLVLTPEQSLVAAVQADINSITKQFPEGLVASIEANFIDSRLTILVDEDWYQLAASKQDQLADSVWERSQKLDFSKFEILATDSREVVARNPVVGDNVVVLKRSI